MLRALGLYLDQLEPKKEKEETSKDHGNWTFWGMFREVQILADALAVDDRKQGGRRRHWTYENITGDWCREKAAKLEKSLRQGNGTDNASES